MYTQISYWAFQGGAAGTRSVSETMRRAKETGFEGIELCVSAAGEITGQTSGDACRAMAREADALGIRLGSIASGLLWDANPASADPAVRARALEIATNALRVTADLGVKHLLMLTGHVAVPWQPAGEVVPYDECYARSVAFAREVGGAAARLGVTACFENVWNRFLLSPLEFDRFLAEVNSPGAAMYFDVGNVWNYGYPQHWIKILAPRIQRVHVKDFNRSVGTLEGFCQLGEGDVPLKESLQLLAQAGYDGPVTAEVFPGPTDTDERKFLTTTLQRIKALMP
jgi:L-ribulose-5-phosphate 3-epimerase